MKLHSLKVYFLKVEEIIFAVLQISAKIYTQNT